MNRWLMDNQSLPFLSRLYLNDLAVLNYSPRTIEHRTMALAHFNEWCEQRGIYRGHEITKPILERYRRYLHHSRDGKGNPVSARNQHGRLIAIRGLFKWATQQNYLLYNAASELQLPKVEKRLPKATLSPPEAEQILAIPDISTGEGIRDRAMLEVLYSTGIRRMELLNLKRNDIHNDREVLAVRQGKGKRDRFVPISHRAMQWLQRYIDTIRCDYAIEPDDGAVFLSVAGEPLNPDQLSRKVTRYIKAANIGKTGSCHLFRHTVATLMLDNGADIRYIQQMLGHVSIGTTEIYTHVSIHKLKQIHELTHPTMKGKQRVQEEVEVTQETMLRSLDKETIEDDASFSE